MFRRTFTGKGLKYVREKAFTTEHGARDGINDVLIVITDGESTDRTNTQVCNSDYQTDGLPGVLLTILVEFLGPYIPPFSLITYVGTHFVFNFVKGYSVIFSNICVCNNFSLYVYHSYLI